MFVHDINEERVERPPGFDAFVLQDYLAFKQSIGLSIRYGMLKRSIMKLPLSATSNIGRS